MSFVMKKKQTISDASLVTSFREGDKTVLPELVKRWHVLFCELAFFYVKDADVAKDIAQESWVVIIRKLEDIRNPEKCKSWAISIVNRKAIDWLRKSSRERIKLKEYYEEKTDRQQEINASSDDETIKISEQLLQGISQLSLHQQEVVQLFYREGCSLKEISKIMSTTVNITKSRLFHAREKLKTIFKNRNHEK